LSGTSAQITVNGRTTSLLLYYTSANQIAGLLPSSTPPGTGTITVTYNGQAGGPSPITVLQNNFGVYTVPQNGSGPGIVTFPDYSLVSQTKAANPGETLIIWGTGLGAVSGDEAAGALPGDMTNLPVQVWLGGVSATVVYRGRSGCCVGEDQIAFVVPANVTGCNLPLAVQINNQVSNYSTMAVAASGRACVPGVPVVPTSVANLPEPRIGFVELEREVNPPPQSPQDQPSSDTASVNMLRLGISGAELNVRNDGPAPGSCMVIPGAPEESDPPILGLLNAGPALTLRGPAGATKTIPRSGAQYAARIGDTTPGNFLDPGAFTLTGPGGPDVGAFTASFTIPAFTWTNKPENNTIGVNRSQGARITWTGGDPEGYVRIGGEAGAPTAGAFAAFECIARAASGSFTIPPSVLLALPANGRGVLTVSSRPSITLFTAGGLDFGGIATSASFRVFANYQ
jgi:uncharacterized protein (TIGR03437 family)